MIPSDPVMLTSYLNLKLRDQYSSLDALCDDLDISKTEILDKLKSAGFIYDANNNQIR